MLPNKYCHIWPNLGFYELTFTFPKFIYAIFKIQRVVGTSDRHPKIPKTSIYKSYTPVLGHPENREISDMSVRLATNYTVETI